MSRLILLLAFLSVIPSIHAAVKTPSYQILPWGVVGLRIDYDSTDKTGAYDSNRNEISYLERKAVQFHLSSDTVTGDLSEQETAKTGAIIFGLPWELTLEVSGTHKEKEIKSEIDISQDSGLSEDDEELILNEKFSQYYQSGKNSGLAYKTASLLWRFVFNRDVSAIFRVGYRVGDSGINFYDPTEPSLYSGVNYILYDLNLKFYSVNSSYESTLNMGFEKPYEAYETKSFTGEDVKYSGNFTSWLKFDHHWKFDSYSLGFYLMAEEKTPSLLGNYQFNDGYRGLRLGSDFSLNNYFDVIEDYTSNYYNIVLSYSAFVAGFQTDKENITSVSLEYVF